jgi:hypothetical protein
MNKLKEISVLAIFVIVVIFASSIVKSKNTSNKNDAIVLPKTTTNYTRIESSFILKKIIFNELFIIKDKRLIEKIKLITENQTDSDFELNDVNADFFSPLEIIECNYKGNILQFIRLQSLNEDATISKKPILNFQIGNETYFLLTDKKINIPQLKNWLQANLSLKYKTISRNEIHIAAFENEKESEHSEISILKNRMKIVVRHKKESQRKHTILKAHGFHVSFELKNGFKIDSVINKIPMLPKIQFPFENIRFVSMNYNGFKFPINDTIIGVPKIDLLVQFQSSTNVDSLIFDLKKQLKSDYPIANNEIYFGKERLYFKQIDSKTIYLSSLHKNPELKTISHPFFIKGDLNLLTKMENAGWKGMFLEVLPMFKSTKTLLKKTKSIQYFHTATNEHTIVIPMKKNRDVYHELILYILSTQVD